MDDKTVVAFTCLITGVLFYGNRKRQRKVRHATASMLRIVTLIEDFNQSILQQEIDARFADIVNHYHD